MQSSAAISNVPIYDVDFYSDEVILDPYPHYAAMRALGGVVYIPQLKNYAVTRFAEVREALRNWQIFSNALGVGADDFACEFFKGASNLFTDPPHHDVIRAAMAPPLKPGAVNELRGQIETAASGLIDRLVKQGSFDGIADLARFLPVTLVTELVGLPDGGRENMLAWANAAFDVVAVQNERGRKGAETLNEMREWITKYATPDRLKPGSLTARIRDMVEKGEIPRESFMGIMNDLITPSLDTTISATGELIYQLARNPDQWAMLKQDRGLVDNAVNEAVRIGTPIRAFSRTLTQDFDIGGVLVPGGSRMMVLFASANHDERHFRNPEQYDIKRTARDHVGFGHGVHMCLGMHLAQLEMKSLLRAMLEKVDRIELSGAPTIAMNNSIHAFATLPTRFHSASAH